MNKASSNKNWCGPR